MMHAGLTMFSGRDGVWRTLGPATWAVLWIVMTWFALPRIAVAQQPPAQVADALTQTVGPPDTVMLDELADRYQPVPFSHKLHADMAQMWDGCETCHHKKPDVIAIRNGHAHAHEDGPAPPPAPDHPAPPDKAQADTVPACKSCHKIDATESDIHMPSLKGAYHRQCLNCHKGWTGENDCVVCHKPAHGHEPEALPTPDDIIGRMHPPIDPPTVKSYDVRYVPAAGGKVTFRHDEHVKTFGIRCAACHVRDTCDSCHNGKNKANRHATLEPAIAWKQSHEPCVACHAQQTCNHCHHKSDDDTPPKFEHAMTGQSLDKNHRDLPCSECHGDMTFTALPTCGDAQCHALNRFVTFPNDLPGEPTTASGPRVLHLGQSVLHNKRQTADLASRTHETDTIPLRLSEPVRHGKATMTTVDRPMTATPSCVTEVCHVAVMSYPVVHGPLAVQACDVCHELTDEARHTFQLRREREDLCTYCHAFDVKAMPVVHAPVTRGECLGCHNPHGGRDHSMTREGSTEALCNRCHDPILASRVFMHTPVGEGDCVACHPPHASMYPKLLDAAGPDLCMTCHDEFRRQLGEATFAHDALKEGCERCHDAHGSAFPKALTATVPGLCEQCHEKTAKEVASATVSHSPVTEGGSCITCHTPHGGNAASLLVDRSETLCLTCHDKPTHAPDGRVIAAIQDVTNNALHKHGPIAEGECRGCHTPHGGNRVNLLVGAFPAGYYAPFKNESYSMCFACHNEHLADQREIPEGQESPTGFRNGSLNLHALHVNKNYGRTCRVCHDAHAGPNDRLVKTQVPYNDWLAPLEFTRTDTGGRCVSACHVPFGYDRDQPVPIDEQREAGQTAQRVRAQPPPPDERSMQWEGRDALGQPITLPFEDKPTLLLLVRGRPESDVQTLKAVRSWFDRKDHDPDAQRVVVVADLAGDNTLLDEVRAVCDASWRIVSEPPADVTGQTPKALPMAVVLEPDGRVVARLGGAPRTLALTVEAYLNLARTSEDPRDAMRKQNNGTVGAHHGVEAEQYLRVVRRLVEQKQYPKALEVLGEAIPLHPEDPSLAMELVRVLVDSGQPAQAIDALDRLPAASRPEPVADVLRARSLIALDRWDAARPIVEAVLDKHPETKDAHYLMGLIHQHTGEWQQAAESFRAAMPASP